MRTTVTFDPDIAAAIDAFRRDEELGWSAAVNQLIRERLAHPPASAAYEHVSYAMGGALVDLTHMREVLDFLDDEPTVPS